MINFSIRFCKVCSKEYLPTGPAAKYCEECSKIRHMEAQRRGQKEFRRRRGFMVNVGKGGATPTGETHRNWKTGERAFGQRMSPLYREKVRYCERCGVDLIDAKQGKWCVHHKDHDRTNNVESNFELLCKKCHQIEHKCWNNFLKV